MISYACGNVTITTKSTITLRLESLQLKEKYNLSEQKKNYLSIGTFQQEDAEIN